MRVPWLPFVVLGVVTSTTAAGAQDEPAVDEPPAITTPEKVDVVPRATDEEIEARLERILHTTGWFAEPSVSVDEGVVVLKGRTRTAEHREWAERLAGRTQDVVAVVNRIEVTGVPLWDLSPAWATLHDMAREVVLALPLLIAGLVILLLTWLAVRIARGVAVSMLERRVEQRLLRQVLANAVAVLVFLLGVYVVLKVAGLTRLAVTLLGGTGLVGLVVGIAFRDIAENFLASILISMQRPFRAGDLIEVDDRLGFVQAVTSRGTLLMDFEGNHVQIPNATVYKSVIKNFTANPNVRMDFAVGIDYADAVSAAQETILEVVREHPATLAEPQPMVLVEKLGAATVDLRIYFWIDGSHLSALKVKSALIRLVKARLVKDGFTLPDEAREVVFPRGVPVTTPIEGERQPPPPREPTAPTATQDLQVSTRAEGELASEAGEIRNQARASRRPDEGQDLLTGDDAGER